MTPATMNRRMNHGLKRCLKISMADDVLIMSQNVVVAMHGLFMMRLLTRIVEDYETRIMKFEYDKKVDAAYIYIEYPLRDGEAKRTIELDGNIILDFDEEGKLLGVEILDASKVLKKEASLEAQVA